MITYLDTSVLLRVILRENGAIDGLRRCEGLVSSELLVVETFRTIDRLRLQGALSLAEAASRRAVATQWLEAVDLVLLRPPILARASDPLPTASGPWTRCIWPRRWFGANAHVRSRSSPLTMAASPSRPAPSGWKSWVHERPNRPAFLIAARNTRAAATGGTPSGPWDLAQNQCERSERMTPPLTFGAIGAG